MVDGVAFKFYCFDMGLLKGPHQSSWLFWWPIHQMVGGQQWLGYKKTSIVLSWNFVTEILWLNFVMEILWLKFCDWNLVTKLLWLKFCDWKGLNVVFIPTDSISLKQTNMSCFCAKSYLIFQKISENSLNTKSWVPWRPSKGPYRRAASLPWWKLSLSQLYN